MGLAIGIAMRRERGRATSARLSVVGSLALLCSVTLSCGTQPAPAARLETPAPPLETTAAAVPVGARTVPQAAEPPTVFHTATGRLAAYDPRTRLVTVEAVTGSSLYRVAADARVWMGRHRLAVSDLAKHLGAQTTVAFAEADGVRTTHTVRLVDGERRSRQ